MPQSDDAVLIAEMLRGHGAALELYAAQWTSAADDCVQEALIELAGLARKPDDPRAWLYRVVRNRALNRARSASRRAAHERLAAQLQQDTGSATDAADIIDAVAGLPDEAREAIVLRIWARMTWEEMAAITGKSSSTMQRRYTDGLHILRNSWEIDPCDSKTNCRAS